MPFGAFDLNWMPFGAFDFNWQPSHALFLKTIK